MLPDASGFAEDSSFMSGILSLFTLSLLLSFVWFGAPTVYFYFPCGWEDRSATNG